MRNKIRKFLTALLIVALMGCLAACGKASLSGDDIAGSQTTVQTTANETTVSETTTNKTTVSETTSKSTANTTATHETSAAAQASSASDNTTESSYTPEAYSNEYYETENFTSEYHENAASETESSYEIYTQETAATAAETTTQVQTLSVSLTIDGCGFGGNGVLYTGSISYTGSMSVYDILCLSGVSISGSSTYVSEIAGMTEKDYGPLSGWKYSVNGVTPGKSCGSYYVNNGDDIYWYYVDTP